MSEKDNGGPAFPTSAPFEMRIDGETHRFQGMTLRQFYAGMALQGLLSNPQIAKDMVKEKIGPETNRAWHADAAFAFADAMIEEGKK